MDYFGKAQNAKNKTEEAQAREKLELVLLDLQTDKVVDPTYNEKEYINDKIQENEMIVSGNIVFVDGYQFQIDRSVPKIGVSIGKGEEDSQIVINMTSKTSDDFVKATIGIEITYEQDIKTIVFDGKNLEIPEKKDEKYVLGNQEVEKNGTYSVLVKGEDDKYNIASVTINDITEDMNIYTAEQLAEFRDKVNSGRTFEGKTVKVMENLDLSSVCGKNEEYESSSISWEPIGNATTQFKGTFDGNYHKIDNIYINTTKEHQGLFGYNSGTIQNLIMMDTGTISGGFRTGSIVGFSTGTINNCGNYINVESKDYGVGGVAGKIENANVNGCYNYGNITSNGKDRDNASYSGGIIGYAEGSKISNCYNVGKITSLYKYAGGIVGCRTVASTDRQYISNSYNIGVISASQYVGSITGAVNRIYRFE